MKKTIKLLSVSFVLMAQASFGEGVRAQEDNTYKSVEIGKQEWMAENLNVSEFRNGDPIPEAKTNSEWYKTGNEGNPAWCYYDNDLANGEKYGKLYNWYVVNDPRGLCPEGWHVPNVAEWITLVDYLGGEDVAGKKMKSTSFWNLGGKGTNESGFSGLPGGGRDDGGTFGDINVACVVGDYGGWWNSTVSGTNDAWGRRLYYYIGYIFSYTTIKKDGISVRCLWD